MKNYLKHTLLKTLFGLLLISLPLVSCRKFISIKPTTSLLGEYIFNSDDALNAALNGVYIAFNSNVSTTFVTPGLFADELVTSTTTLTSTDYIAQTNSYTPDNDYGYFSTRYAAIYNANSILAGIDNAPKITSAVAAQVKGECLFLRAFCNFQLVNYYGPVPYVTSTDANVSAIQGNTPVTTTYQNIIADLKTAAGLISDSYRAASRTSANKQAVNALLAKVYLYSKDWANAETIATTVINSGLYTITPNLTNVFESTSNETIFQLYNANGIALGTSLVPGTLTAVPFTYSVRSDLVNAYSAGDLRKGTWLMSGTGAAASSYYFNKYKLRTASTTVKEYFIMFRLAEMYLIRAEARAQLNTPASIAAGATDLQVTRARAGLTTPLVIATSTDLLSAVAAERRKELAIENGNRWFDLNRTGQTVNVLNASSKGITVDSHIMLLPFPKTTVIFVNPNIIQNPGYPQ